jgi:hypothetical protein
MRPAGPEVSIASGRIRQHQRRSLDRRTARPASWEPTIPDSAASSTKKPPINRWEHRYLGEERFPATLSALEIEHFFTLDEDELVSVRTLQRASMPAGSRPRATRNLMELFERRYGG